MPAVELRWPSFAHAKENCLLTDSATMTHTPLMGGGIFSRTLTPGKAIRRSTRLPPMRIHEQCARTLPLPHSTHISRAEVIAILRFFHSYSQASRIKFGNISSTISKVHIRLARSRCFDRLTAANHAAKLQSIRRAMLACECGADSGNQVIAAIVPIHFLARLARQVFDLACPRFELLSTGNEGDAKTTTVSVLELCGQLFRFGVEFDSNPMSADALRQFADSRASDLYRNRRRIRVRASEPARACRASPWRPTSRSSPSEAPIPGKCCLVYSSAKLSYRPPEQTLPMLGSWFKVVSNTTPV